MTRTELQVLFLTGRSDPRTCALSPEQHAFLDALQLPSGVAVRLNFPYDVPAESAPWRPVPLWLASLRHVALFVRTRDPWRRRWARRHRPAVLARFDRAERTLVLAGSIGLDLLGRLDLPADVLDRLTVLAYGPVATRPPRARTVRVASRHDHVARWWPADVEVDAGHLDYLAAPALLDLARGLVDELEATP